MVKVTRHATKRTTKRLGIPKRATKKNAERALQYGIRHTEARGGLNRYMTALFFRHETANNIRIYCGTVYIFKDEELITLFPLPQRFRKTAEYIKKKKESQQTTYKRIIKLVNDEIQSINIQSWDCKRYNCCCSELLIG